VLRRHVDVLRAERHPAPCTAAQEDTVAPDDEGAIDQRRIVLPRERHDVDA
jgi:hypothetical protein